MYEVVDENDSRLLKDELAKYLLEKQRILIKESVYLELINDIGRSRFTLTHEFAH